MSLYRTRTISTKSYNQTSKTLTKSSWMLSFLNCKNFSKRLKARRPPHPCSIRSSEFKLLKTIGRKGKYLLILQGSKTSNFNSMKTNSRRLNSSSKLSLKPKDLTKREGRHIKCQRLSLSRSHHSSLLRELKRLTKFMKLRMKEINPPTPTSFQW